MGIGAATITRRFGTLLAFLVALAVFAGLLLVFAPTAEAISSPNEKEHWEDLYPNAVRCWKFDSPTEEVHGTATDEGVVLNEFEWNNSDWPGDHWEVLIVKGGNGDGGNAVYEHPEAGILYTAPDGKDVSHWIVCKGEDPEPEDTPRPTTPRRTTPPRTTPPAEPGLIIVKKEVTGGSSTDQSFVFTASYDGDGFSLKHGELNQSGDLAAGTYSVSETVPDGWTRVSAVCDDQSDPLEISLQEGETVTCTFVNDVPVTVSPTSIVNTTTPEASPETLPFTGADSGPHAALALVLIAAGALALVGARVFRAGSEE